MKKLLFVAATVAFLGTAFAQEAQPTQPAKKECCKEKKNEKCCKEKKDKKCCKDKKGNSENK